MWSPGPGVIELPSGLTVRGRSLRAGVPAGTSEVVPSTVPEAPQKEEKKA